MAYIQGAYQLGKAIMEQFDAAGKSRQWTHDGELITCTKSNTRLAHSILQTAAFEAGFTRIASLLNQCDLVD
jgi:hypothetical protein